MEVTCAIVKVYIIEGDDVMKRHSNVFTIRRPSAVEVIALLKNRRSEMKGVQEKESIIGVGVDRKIPPGQ